METEIGPTLREARIRRHIDLAEVEKQTKIRVRYLRALENEEWDVLPGPTYTRSFIRTYATFLGLDGERLADDLRRLQDQRGAEIPTPREPLALPPRTAGRGPRLGAGLVTALVFAGLIAVIVVLGLTGDEEGAGDPNGAGPAKAGNRQAGTAAKGEGRGVSIRLTATAEVWVCAIDARGTPVLNGEILQAGSQEGPFRSGSFELAFGNGSVGLQVDGSPFQVEDSPSPVGYRVTPNQVRPLPEGSRPDCA